MLILFTQQAVNFKSDLHTELTAPVVRRVWNYLIRPVKYFDRKNLLVVTFRSFAYQYANNEAGAGEHDAEDGGVRQQPRESRDRANRGLLRREEEDRGFTLRVAAQVSTEKFS